MVRYTKEMVGQKKLIISLRCISIIQPTYDGFHSLKGTFLLLATNILYAAFFATGIFGIVEKIQLIKFPT
jgi:hypothetical protein